MYNIFELITLDVLNEHDLEHNLEHKPLFSTPKIFDANGDLSKRWYVYFSYRNPETGKLKRVKNIYGKVVDEVYDPSNHYRSFDLEKFSKLWYNKEFTPMTTKLKKLYKNKYYDNDDIENMCLQYLKTVQWCNLYYTEGYKDVSNYHFYNYRYLTVIYI